MIMQNEWEEENKGTFDFCKQCIYHNDGKCIYNESSDLKISASNHGIRCGRFRTIKPIAYLCETFDEYAKIVTYCIKYDIVVFRSYWNNNEKHMCYHIDFEEKRLFFSPKRYYEYSHYDIQKPLFRWDEYGEIEMIKHEKGQ